MHVVVVHYAQVNLTARPTKSSVEALLLSSGLALAVLKQLIASASRNIRARSSLLVVGVAAKRDTSGLSYLQCHKEAALMLEISCTWE